MIQEFPIRSIASSTWPSMQIWTNFLILFNLSFLYESRNNDTYTKIVAKINETISIKLLYG